jgi:hypothetical protein
MSFDPHLVQTAGSKASSCDDFCPTIFAFCVQTKSSSKERLPSKVSKAKPYYRRGINSVEVDVGRNFEDPAHTDPRRIGMTLVVET